MPKTFDFLIKCLLQKKLLVVAAIWFKKIGDGCKIAIIPRERGLKIS